MQENQHSGPAPESFKIKIGDTNLQFRDATVSDPVPTGRQIIKAAGDHNADEYIVLQYTSDRDLKEIGLDDTVDVRPAGAERFLVVKSDRTFRFEIDDRRMEWPAATITREVLLELANQDPTKFSVWLDQREGGQDKEILSGHPADLSGKGTERFYTVMSKTTEGAG